VRITRGEDVLIIEFGAPPISEGKTISADFVLDKNGFGEVIGVEILDLQRQTGPGVMGPDHEGVAGEGDMRVGYDEEADALYVNLAVGERSLDQNVVRGVITLDSEGRLARLEATTTR
jgi:uncharacterized protein YuzE